MVAITPMIALNRTYGLSIGSVMCSEAAATRPRRRCWRPRRAAAWIDCRPASQMIIDAAGGPEAHDGPARACSMSGSFSQSGRVVNRRRGRSRARPSIDHALAAELNMPEPLSKLAATIGTIAGM